MGRLFYGSGVIPGYQQQFAATVAAGVATIQPGGVWIDGFYGETTANKTMPVSGSGMIVARADPTATSNNITIVYVATPGYAPAQNPNGVFEIPLYTVTSGLVADARQFANAAPNKQAGGRIYRAGAYKSTTAWTTYGFDQPTPRPANFSGGTFTCPYAANYLVIAQVGFVSTALQQWYDLALMRTTT